MEPAISIQASVGLYSGQVHDGLLLVVLPVWRTRLLCRTFWLEHEGTHGAIGCTLCPGVGGQHRGRLALGPVHETRLERQQGPQGHSIDLRFARRTGRVCDGERQHLDRRLIDCFGWCRSPGVVGESLEPSFGSISPSSRGVGHGLGRDGRFIRRHSAFRSGRYFKGQPCQLRAGVYRRQHRLYYSVCGYASVVPEARTRTYLRAYP